MDLTIIEPIIKMIQNDISFLFIIRKYLKLITMSCDIVTIL